MVEGLGHLARFELTQGQAGDITRAADLLDGLPVQVVMADTAYDAAHLIDPLHERGVTTVIPSHPIRKHPRPLDKYLYHSRDLVKRWLCRVKQFLRIATRYDKLAARSAVGTMPLWRHNLKMRRIHYRYPAIPLSLKCAKCTFKMRSIMLDKDHP